MLQPNWWIDRQAQQWVQRLSDTPWDAVAIEQFRRWLARSPRHARRFLLQLEQMQELDLLQQHPKLQQLLERPCADDRAGWLPWLSLLSAMALLLLALHYHPTPAVDDDGELLSSTIGQTRAYTLDDGSQLLLSPNSRLRISLGTQRREVELLQGSALFQVSRDPLRPFVVHSHGTQVTVLGTVFEVYHSEQRTQVSVLEGKVQVQDGVLEEQLLPGDQLSVGRRGNPDSRRLLNPEEIAPWRYQRLEFHDKPLVELVDDLKRYGLLQLQLADPGLRQMRLSGSFDWHDQDSLLAALSASLPIEMKPVGKRWVLFYRP